jgi:small-conductance mechanosensitive channel
MASASLWGRIAAAGPAAVVMVGATLALIALLALRRLAPRNRRHRGRAARLCFGVAFLLAGSAVGVGTMGAASPGNLLQLAGLLALAVGLLGMAGFFVFDVILPRFGIEVPSILSDLVLVVIALAMGMGFLRLAGLDVFSVVTTSAVLTAVIGLALQSTIANVFGGLGLQLDRTLRRGEWIEVGSHVGKILEIGWRATRIRTKEDDTVFVPNAELVSKDVRTFGRSAGPHRMTMRIGFHYRHPPHEIRRVLLAAIRDTPGVVEHPEPECGPGAFGDSAVLYALRYWINDFANDTRIDEEVHARIWYAAQRADLEMPYPTRMLVPEHGAARARAAAGEHAEEKVLRLLETVEPFSRIDLESRRRCARGVRRLAFGRGEHVLRSDEPDDRLYVIDSGEVALQRGSNGATRELSTFCAGELVGRAVLPSHDACTARSEVVLYQLDGHALADAVAANPEVGAGLSAIAEARRAAVEESNGPVEHDHRAETPRLVGRFFRRR